MTTSVETVVRTGPSHLSSIVPIHPLSAQHKQAQACGECGVQRLALFAALDIAELSLIHTPIQALELSPDENLFGVGELGSAVFTIRSGIMRFERFTQGGDRRIVRLAGRGDLIGQEALLGHRYVDQAIACTSVQLCSIPAQLIDELCARDANLSRELMSRWQGVLDDAQAWVADLSAGPARRRMLKLLVWLGEHADPSGRIWLPRRDEIGDMLDITVETASRMVSSLRREGVLELPSPRIARLDPEALKRAVNDADRH